MTENQPTVASAPRSMLRAVAASDLTALAAFACLFWVLVPHQAGQLSASQGQRIFSDVLGEMTSWYLLPSLGLVLAMRRGVIDASVWMTMSLGAALAAVMLGTGGPSAQDGPWPLAIAAVVVAAGGAVGAFNAFLATVVRVPGTIATLATALGLWALINWLFGPLAQQRQIPAADMAMQSLILPGYTLLASRMLLVALAYSAVMLGILAASAPARQADDELPSPAIPKRPRTTLALSLILSGALSAAGGFAWLMGNPASWLPAYPIGDLRVAAAALLTGALFLRGHGRTLLAALLLPPAMLVATLWYQNVWYMPSLGPLAGDLLVLLAMVILAQWTGLGLRRKGCAPMRLAAWLVALAGLGLLAGSALAMHQAQDFLRWAGIGMSAAAAVLATADWVLRRRAG